MNTRPIIAILLAATAVAGCAPDPPDVYSAGDAPPATLGVLPTTTVAAVGEDAPEVVVYPANGETVDVRSLDNSFVTPSPTPTLEIEAGTKVNWINGGRNDHNVLPVDESLTWGVERDAFAPGDTYAHVFDVPGVYPYYCSIHGNQDVGMVGAIIVTEPA